MAESTTDGPTGNSNRSSQSEAAEAVERYPYHRRFIRHKVRIKVDIQADRSFQAWTHNLSQDGLCFEIPDCLDPGREVTVWLFLDKAGNQESVQVRCRVVWRDESPKGSRHGGQFLFFAADGQARLRDWLAERAD